MLFLPARKEKLWNWGLIPRWFWYKKVANLNPPPKKLKKPMQKKSSFRKKTDTYIFLMFLLGWFQVTGIPLPSKIPRSVGPQPAPVAPGAQRRTGGRPGMWPSAPGRAGASPHCQPRRRCWWCPGPWWGPQAPGWDEKWADLGGCFRDILGIFGGYGWWVVCWFFGDMVDEWCVVHGQSFDVGMVKKGVYRGCRRDRDYKDGDEHGETEKDSPKSWPILILKKQVHSFPIFHCFIPFRPPMSSESTPSPPLSLLPSSFRNFWRSSKAAAFLLQVALRSLAYFSSEAFSVFVSSKSPGGRGQIRGLGSEHLGNRNATHWKPKSNHSEWNAHKLACTILDPRKWVLLAGAISAQTHA